MTEPVGDINTQQIILNLNAILPDDIKAYLNLNVFGFTVFLIGNNTNNMEEYHRAYIDSGAYLDYTI